ncbi:phosphoribosyltransferase family protein [Scleromatobacter humisilvae]|uniref:ComF family protein n=1 Tax=Scleromatobacter humisilvae TaxID=2897159 RepID=A0A9X1YSI3_9BURK|nr:phosphoribosyltransferase family protein [Scleromatobacter humisilvae]MCK9688416.1 ComF family protein [Scleromatobacter humisilvae]
MTNARNLLARWRAAAGGRCLVCRGWCDGGLCRHCDARFAFARERCDGCGLPFVVPPTDGDNARCVRCRLAPPPWSRVVTGVDYGYPWDRPLADLKFHQRLEPADALLRPLLARLDDLRGSDVRVACVPLSRERLRERGYNQSWELARRLARALSLDARADALFRVRDTGHQLGLHRSERARNLQGAFVVTPRHAAWVRGARIALVDDVLTTGATAQAATRTLRAAGAREVHVWVVARTPES